MKRQARLLYLLLKLLGFDKFYSVNIDIMGISMQLHFDSIIVKKLLSFKFTYKLTVNGHVELSKYISGIYVEIILT